METFSTYLLSPLIERDVLNTQGARLKEELQGTLKAKMERLMYVVLMLLCAQPWAAQGQAQNAPTVTTANGTYIGVYNEAYNEDFFLGIPYAQPPTGNLRFQLPASINTSFSGTRDATAYYPECVGYGVLLTFQHIC